MAGNFDSNVGSVDFLETTVASNASALLSTQTYVFPYDAEVVAAAISGQTGTTGANVWANVKYWAPGVTVATTSGTALFSRPSAAATISAVKVDQSYVTVTSTGPATTATAATGGITNSTTLSIGAVNANVSVGQGVVVAGTNQAGNYVTVVSSSTQFTLAKPVTVAAGATVAFYTSPTPQPGQQVQLLSIAHAATAGEKSLSANALAVLNNPTTPGAPAAAAYTITDSSETTSNQTFRLGPIKQAGLYDTGSGFWRFTTDKINLTAGTFQIIDAPVLSTPTTAGRTAATVGYPDNAAFIPAGAVLSVEWNSVNSAGAALTGAVATSVSLNLAIKKR